MGRFSLLSISAAAIIGLWALMPLQAQAIDFGTDLVASWSFNEGSGTTVGDSSGLGNHGSLSGAAAFISDPVRGGVLDFTGPTGVVSVPHSASLEPAYGAIATWVKISQYQNADVVSKTTNYWVNRNISGGFSAYGLRITDNGGVVGFVGNDDPSATGPWSFASTSGGLLTLDVWHELAVRWNGGTVDTFVDGVLQASTAYVPTFGTGLSYSGSSPVRLGAATMWAVTGDREFIGQMDDVRIWNVQPVPEPSTLLLIGSGLMGLGMARRRFKA